MYPTPIANAHKIILPTRGPIPQIQQYLDKRTNFVHSPLNPVPLEIRKHVNSNNYLITDPGDVNQLDLPIDETRAIRPLARGSLVGSQIANRLVMANGQSQAA